MARRSKKSAVHNLSHSVKYSDYLGYLTPIACIDCVPGDVFNHKISALIRTQPLLAPVMHSVDIDVHAFFSPDRLVWLDSEDFHSGGDDGLDASVAPYMVAPASTGYAVGSLADYLGLPTGVPDYQHSALPFRHYINIYRHWYRDSQLMANLSLSTASGLDTTTTKTLQRPAWKRDYFTKCRPEPQLGPEVVIPLGGDAPVQSNGQPFRVSNAGGESTVDYQTATAGRLTVEGAPGTPTVGDSLLWGTETGLEADLSAVTGIPVSELREASATQRFLEKNNIWGGRYMEQLMARFGVLPQDFRLQWPEFLGAGHTKIQFSEVLATAETGTAVDVGDMKGHGISVLASNRYRYKVREHGYIMVFLIMRPKTQYFQGIHRSWSRETRYDYLLPEFVHIGDQAVLNKELYAAAATPTGIFGYTPIYEEYRTVPSRVAGEFRSTLKYWHMAREFSSEPALNSTFVTANPTNRIFPNTAAAQVYVDVKHDIAARRLLPKTPGYKLM